jgi:hypothetical protein
MTPERWRQIEDLYHAALLECTDPEIRWRVQKMLAIDSDGKHAYIKSSVHVNLFRIPLH